MCLVTYLPTDTGYILSSNRDEYQDRAETELIEETLHGHLVTYPRDIKGGSWIFSSLDSKNVVLLNGAFQLHERKLPYRMSRGLMVKEFYSYESAREFTEQFNFEGLEPFTLIMNDRESFMEMRWDGQAKYLKSLDRKLPHIWSSCTLYNDELQSERSDLFHELIVDKVMGIELAESIHNHKGSLPESYDFNMSRDYGVRTISTTYISSDNQESRLVYNDKA